MADMKAHVTKLADNEGDHILIHPASPESVGKVLSADPTSVDGRSPFVWVRFPNGDLVLGVFPQGETYLDVENDAEYPAL